MFRARGTHAVTRRGELSGIRVKKKAFFSCEKNALKIKRE
jgi:hypothetical protein